MGFYFDFKAFLTQVAKNGSMQSKSKTSIKFLFLFYFLGTVFLNTICADLHRVRGLTALRVWAYTGDPLFHLLFAVGLYLVNSRGIQLVSSHNEIKDRDLQSLIFRSNIRYILHVLEYSASVGFFKSNTSTFFVCRVFKNHGQNYGT